MASPQRQGRQPVPAADTASADPPKRRTRKSTERVIDLAELLSAPIAVAAKKSPDVGEVYETPSAPW